MPLIERSEFPGLPNSMEARLFNEKGLEPAIVLYHPKAELYVLMGLLDRFNLQKYVDELNSAVLKQAMGEPPENEEGYRIDR